MIDDKGQERRKRLDFILYMFGIRSGFLVFLSTDIISITAILFPIAVERYRVYFYFVLFLFLNGCFL